MTEITVRRRLILHVVNAYRWEDGQSPSLREIGNAVGLSSTSSVAWQVRALQAAGLLAWTPGRTLTLHLGPRAAGSRDGVIAQVVLAECRTCRRLLPPDHRCDPGREAAA